MQTIIKYEEFKNMEKESKKSPTPHQEIQKEIEELKKRILDIFNPTMMIDIDKLEKLQRKIKKENK